MMLTHSHLVRSRRMMLRAALPAALFAALPRGLRAQSGTAPGLPEAIRMPTATLHARLAGELAQRPLVLQVGSRVLYQQAHIIGSEYVGAAAGADALARRVAALPRDKEIVLYCGCCPWERCPNIAPAYQQLHQLGFTRVKVLYLPHNFGDDWVQLGYGSETSK